MSFLKMSLQILAHSFIASSDLLWSEHSSVDLSHVHGSQVPLDPLDGRLQNKSTPRVLSKQWSDLLQALNGYVALHASFPAAGKNWFSHRSCCTIHAARDEHGLALLLLK